MGGRFSRTQKKRRPTIIEYAVPAGEPLMERSFEFVKNLDELTFHFKYKVNGHEIFALHPKHGDFGKGDFNRDRTFKVIADAIRANKPYDPHLNRMRYQARYGNFDIWVRPDNMVRFYTQGGEDASVFLEVPKDLCADAFEKAHNFLVQREQEDRDFAMPIIEDEIDVLL
jgi:hypothetical protein